MFFGKWRKKEKEFEEKFKEFEEAVILEETKKEKAKKRDPQKIEKYVVERLEQLLEVTREIDDQKTEYRRVTSYLNDIEKIEKLPEKEKKEITDTAQNVVQLNRARMNFLNSAKKLTDAQFILLEREEENINGVAKRLAANERYRDALRKDMRYLERDKEEWKLRREFLVNQSNHLRNMIYALTGLAAAGAVILLVLQIGMNMDVFYGWMALAFLSAVSISATYLRMQNDWTEIRMADHHLNRVIVLQNKIKLKYVNVVNAVDYACEKYHVRSAAELNEQWQYYLETVKEREKYQRTNEDLEYYNGKLIRQLKRQKLYDSQIWITQAEALVDPKEMVEIKHGMVTRRQKLRSQIEYNFRVIKKGEQEAKQLLDKVGDLRPQVEEILEAIDRMSKA